VRAALEPTLPVEPCASLHEAVVRAHAEARPGDVVLLAPACSSFDMFRDYAERGRAFKAEVRQLEARGASGGARG
jgi:UDP-N-acetylmuramoylalanine--D-glutamate ligase